MEWILEFTGYDKAVKKILQDAVKITDQLINGRCEFEKKLSLTIPVEAEVESWWNTVSHLLSFGSSGDIMKTIPILNELRLANERDE